MSMPERIWRIVRGRWLIAEERDLEFQAEEQAVEELNESLAAPSRAHGLPSSATEAPRFSYSPSANPKSKRPEGTQNPKSIDPLADDLARLGAPPACDMATLDRLYAARLAELGVEQLPVGSPEHAQAAAGRAALAEAYERLRDAINTTETRFEKLEF